VKELSNPELSPSRVYRLLHPCSAATLAALRVAVESPVARRHIDLYTHKLTYVKPRTDGHDLKRMGIPRGPVYREVLEALRDERLDGRVRTRADEEALVQQLIVERKLVTNPEETGR
jgi:tRNA nucleotidyltransferase (CCA-adding enzyme)